MTGTPHPRLGPLDKLRRDPCRLTPAEEAALGLLVEGLRPIEMRARLRVSKRVVDLRLQTIREKLGVASNAEAAALAQTRRAS